MDLYLIEVKFISYNTYMIIFTIIDILKDRTGVYILFKTIQYGITSELSGATITRYGPKYTDTY